MANTSYIIAVAMPPIAIEDCYLELCAHAIANHNNTNMAVPDALPCRTARISTTFTHRNSTLQKRWSTRLTQRLDFRGDEVMFQQRTSSGACWSSSVRLSRFLITTAKRSGRPDRTLSGSIARTSASAAAVARHATASVCHQPLAHTLTGLSTDCSTARLADANSILAMSAAALLRYW